MSKEQYLILAISILVALLILFIVSFILYRRTPAPKGCESIKISEENCAACNNKECQFKAHRDEEE